MLLCKGQFSTMQLTSNLSDHAESTEKADCYNKTGKMKGIQSNNIEVVKSAGMVFAICSKLGFYSLSARFSRQVALIKKHDQKHRHFSCQSCKASSC